VSQSPAAGTVVRRAVEALGGVCLLPDDPEFPEALRSIPQPPVLLFALGNPGLLATPSVAIVGSRDHSDYGERTTRRIAGAAAEAGITVVSGMARGLDAEAHSAALDAGGGTIGVLGNGLGVVYPAANRRLYQRVQREGLLVTEHPPGDKPHAGSFPKRNRLISGLASVTVVVEAAAGSGTLITVETALDQGKDVMAVPGPVTSPTSVGTNRLIRDGAMPLLVPDDLLELYGRQAGTRREQAPSKPIPQLSPEDTRLVSVLGAAPVQLDILAETVRQPVADVLDRLCALELEGVVEQRPGRLFVRR
jgi:DNA processing protein